MDNEEQLPTDDADSDVSRDDESASTLDETRAFDFERDGISPEDRFAINKLNERYNHIVSQDSVSWEIGYNFVRKLGAGGQGIVYLTDREGAFGVNFQLALKFHRPDGYPTEASYRQEMARMARIAMEMARVQHDHLLDIYNVVELDGILVLVSEWVDGFDIRQLLSLRTLNYLQLHVKPERFASINDVVMTRAGFQARFKVGIAISILRECLLGLAALHRDGIVHADIKPSNIMVKRSGNCKLIDPGSAHSLTAPPSRPLWTPRYAAVEVIEGRPHSYSSDLASLGYVLFEMVSGKYPFVGTAEGEELVQAKIELWEKLENQLPESIASNKTLVNLIKRLIAPQPEDRFASADEANLSAQGAGEIQRQLVKMKLDSEYVNDLRVLMEELGDGPDYEII